MCHSKHVLVLLATVLVLSVGACASTVRQKMPPLDTGKAMGCPADANLLADAAFETVQQPGRGIWRTAQHAQGSDFSALAAGDSLTIKNLEDEAWFLFTQRISTDLPIGAELQYDALLTLNTFIPPERGHEFGYVSGLYLVGFQAGQRSASFRRLADHSPNLGQHAQQRVITRVVTESPITQVTAGFVHQSGGDFSVSDPRLINLSSHPGCRLP